MAGHDRGAGIAVQAAALALQSGVISLTANLLLAPAQLSAASYSAARLLNQPTVIIAGSSDCVAPIASNAQPLYDSCAAACKELVTLPEGSHCKFTTACPSCLQLEIGCTSLLSDRLQRLFALSYAIDLLPNNPSAFADKTIFDTSNVRTTVQTTYRNHSGLEIMQSPARLCEGDTVTFTVNQSLSSYSFFWLPDSVRTPIYKKVVFGTANVRLVIVDPCANAVFDAQASTCSPHPFSMNKTVSLCKGASANLQVYNASQYQSISWSDGQKGAIVTVNKAGTYVVHAVDSTCCREAIDSVRVFYRGPFGYHLKSIEISSPCDSQSVYQIPSGASNTEVIQWNNGSKEKVLTVDKDSTYRFWAVRTDSVSKCVTITDTLELVVKSAQNKYPIPAIQRRGDTLYSTAANFYQWKCNGQFIDGATDQYYVPKVPGLYTVFVILDSVLQCNRESLQYAFVLSSVADDNSSMSVRLEDKLLYISCEKANETISVFNVLGQCVCRRAAAQGLTVIDAQDFPPGLYIVEWAHTTQPVLIPR